MRARDQWLLIALLFGCGLAVLTANHGTAQAPDKPSKGELIESALDTKVSVDFAETELGDVAAHLQDQLKIDIQLDTKALDGEGVATETPITLHVNDVSARSLLNLLLGPLGLSYFVRDGVVVISTPDKIASQPRTVVYAVGDLVQSENEFGETIQDVDWLMELITSSLMPTTWDEVGGAGLIAYFDGALIVNQTDDSHQRIAGLLAGIRRLRDQPTDAKPPAYLYVEDWETANEVVRQKLEQSISLDFQEKPLSEVAQFLSELLKINVLIDSRAMEDSGVSADDLVTFQTKTLSAAAALKSMLAPHDLQFVVRNETVLITTLEISSKEEVLAFYPVGDLLDATPAMVDDFQELIQAIQFAVQPVTWEAVGGPGRVASVPIARALLVSINEDVHRDLRALLADVRKARAANGEPGVSKDPSALETRIYHWGLRITPAAKPEKPEAATKPEKPTPSEPTTKEIAELIKDLIEPKSWKEESTFVRVAGDKLIIRQTAAIHQKIRCLLISLAGQSAQEKSGPVYGPTESFKSFVK